MVTIDMKKAKTSLLAIYQLSKIVTFMYVWGGWGEGGVYDSTNKNSTNGKCVHLYIKL